jgi:predicted porin
VYSSNPISTINGVDMLWRLNFGDASLLLQPYYGTSQGAQALVPQEVVSGIPALQCTPGVPPSNGVCSWGPSPSGTVAYADFSADRMLGVNMSLGTDIFTVRAGYLQTLVSAAAFGVSEDDVKFSSVGGTLDWRNVVLYSEYFQRRISGSANAAFPNQKGYYATVGYRIGKFLPNLTYAKLDKNPETGDIGAPLLQTSATLGLRYELGTGAALKFEAQQIKPEANGVTGARGLLIGVPENNKATIYGIAVDVVF